MQQQDIQQRQQQTQQQLLIQEEEEKIQFQVASYTIPNGSTMMLQSCLCTQVFRDEDALQHMINHDQKVAGMPLVLSTKTYISTGARMSWNHRLCSICSHRRAGFTAAK